MINVAFLLLIFFLMSSVIAPPAPVDIAPPSTSESSSAVDGARLFIDADGQLIGDGGSIIQNLTVFSGQPVAISADASLPANTLVKIIERMRLAGTTEIVLVASSNFE
ncbi:MAG: ExbD/TolR family protein [Boseongicola sp.]